MKECLKHRCFAALISAFLVASTSSSAQTNEPRDKSSTSERKRANELSKYKAGQQLADAQGRLSYIVDLFEDKASRPNPFADPKIQSAQFRAKAAEQIADVIRGREIDVTGSTKFVGVSFTAFLTEAQVRDLAEDSRVRRISKNKYLQPSSALWSSTTDVSGQHRSWGLYAMGGLASAGSSAGTHILYVIDTGVGTHSDLNVISRYAAENEDGYPPSPAIYTNGCYEHSTHVAGIAGAYDNSAGVVGANPGVKIVSIAIGTANDGSCSVDYSYGNIITALDMIYDFVLNSGKVGVVNLSYNDSSGVFRTFAADQPVGEKMLYVATPTYPEGSYRGALIVQSAGNQFDDVGTHSFAYDDGLHHYSSSATDGIIVVGGLDMNGQPVSNYPSMGLSPYYSNATTGFDGGSNFGATVEMWAPSQQILSTYEGSVGILSGTSMAAPFVAGLATRLLEADSYITTSTLLEWTLRYDMVTITGSGLNIPQYSPGSYTAVPTVEMKSEDNNLPLSISPINVSHAASGQPWIRMAAIGAATTNSCYIDGYRNSSLYLSEYIGATYQIPSLTAGTYYWTITCTSPQSTTTTVGATAVITP